MPFVQDLVVASTQVSCTIVAGGIVRCWGDNNWGELGNGSDAFFSNVPVTVDGIADATALATGAAHVCAIVTRGHVKCWGHNAFGQLGNLPAGSTIESPPSDSFVPVTVANLDSATAIAAGYGHTCVIVTGTVRCWGAGIGGAGAWSPTPVTVEGITDATDIAANEDYTCARLATGHVDCWGTNHATGDPDTTVPVEVPDLTDAVRVAVGREHACAVTADGHVRCWGANTDGELGDGTTTDATTPTFVSGIANAVGVTAGEKFACAVLDNGQVRCWGDNGFNALGDGHHEERALTPVRVSNLDNAAAIAGSFVTVCVIRTNNDRACWGSNQGGTLGTGNNHAYATTPSPVVDL
jgi:alpha-tubulin suppressor-like RCC1 family protein